MQAYVRWTLRRIRATPEAQALEAEGLVKLVGAVLSLSTGVVRFLEEWLPPAERTVARPEAWSGPVGARVRRGAGSAGHLLQHVVDDLAVLALRAEEDDFGVRTHPHGVSRRPVEEVATGE